MMDQTHIGYTYWQQPLENKMPEVEYVSKDSAVEQDAKIDVRDITSENLIPKNEKENFFYEKNYVSNGDAFLFFLIFLFFTLTGNDLF